MKRIFAITSLCLIAQISSAEICPNVNDVKNPKLSEWTLHDSENGKPLSPKQVSQFKNSATKFVLAEWSNDKKGTAIHCYYSDNNGANLEAYLSKANFIPDNVYPFWYHVSGFMQCAASNDKCVFRQKTMSQQIAKK